MKLLLVSQHLMCPLPKEAEEKGSDDVQGIKRALDFGSQVFDPDKLAYCDDNSMSLDSSAMRFLLNEYSGLPELGEEVVKNCSVFITIYMADSIASSVDGLSKGQRANAKC